MPAHPFVPWSFEHLLVLALTFCVPLALGVWSRRDATGARGRFTAWTIAFGLLVQIGCVLILVGLPLTDRWQDLMPLHLCDLVLFVCVAACITRTQRPFEIAYFWGLGGTLQGLLTPDLGQGFPSWECILFFAGHGGIVACVVFLIVAFRLRPTWRSVARAYVWIIAYALVAGIFNALFATNYGFLCAKPLNPSLFDWLGPWPWYIASAAALAGVFFVVLYLPWAVADRLRDANRTRQESERRSRPATTRRQS